MAKNKTTFTNQDVLSFIDAFVDNQAKKEDSYQLISLMEACTGEKAKMYGPSIIGFGEYHYQYASGHQGDAPVIAFSPRKAAITLYVFSNTPKSQELITQLGKFKQTKGCIYIKKLSDINLSILKDLCLESIDYISQHHECSCKGKSA